jgi:hypothetical protein
LTQNNLGSKFPKIVLGKIFPKNGEPMDKIVENPALPILQKAIRCLLRPLAKTIMQHGMSFTMFVEEAKKVFLDVAEQEFSLAGRKQSAARVAIITGISRKEISRIRHNDSNGEDEIKTPPNRAARVISCWVSDATFHDKSGQPRELTFDGESPTFTDLVRKSSGDMLVRAMLDELVRVGAVEVVNKRIRLINRSYIPVNSEVEKLRILGTDVAKLIETVNHNMQKDQNNPFFQRKVYYDNLPEEALDEIRALVRSQGQQLIEFLDKKIQTHDRDVNPQVRGSGTFTAGVGVYYFESSSSGEGA